MSDTPRTDRMFETKHAFYSVWDFARQLERELNALRSEQMTEAKAREVLGDWIDEEDDDRGLSDKSRQAEDYFPVFWNAEDPEEARKCYLSNHFTSLQLKAIAWWMDNMGGER